MNLDFNAHKPHEVAELLCAKCLKRWIGVFPLSVLLKEIECPNCGEAGFTIKTGQEFNDEQ